MPLSQTARHHLATTLAEVGGKLTRASVEARRGRARAALALCWEARVSVGDLIRDLAGLTFRPNATTRRRPETLAEWIAMDADENLRDLERIEPDARGQVGRFFDRPRVTALRLEDEPYELGAAVDHRAIPSLVLFEWCGDGGRQGRLPPDDVDVRRIEVRSETQARWLMDLLVEAFPGLEDGKGAE